MGALPMADVTIYYIDIRSFGKGFDEFYQQSRGMGVEFVKGKIGEIHEKDDGDLVLKYEDIITGALKETEHDLVILSVGILPNLNIKKIFKNSNLELDIYNYVKQVDVLKNPAETSIEGVFVAGTASGPMDIPDSISSAGAAAAVAVSYLRRMA